MCDTCETRSAFSSQDAEGLEEAIHREAHLFLLLHALSALVRVLHGVCHLQHAAVSQAVFESSSDFESSSKPPARSVVSLPVILCSFLLRPPPHAHLLAHIQDSHAQIHMHRYTWQIPALAYIRKRAKRGLRHQTYRRKAKLTAPRRHGTQRIGVESCGRRIAPCGRQCAFNRICAGAAVYLQQCMCVRARACMRVCARACMCACTVCKRDDWTGRKREEGA